MMFGLSAFPQTKSNDAPASSGITKAKSKELPVKKSRTGICRVPGSSYYSRTKHFTSFKTIDECLNSGGRLLKK